MRIAPALLLPLIGASVLGGDRPYEVALTPGGQPGQVRVRPPADATLPAGAELVLAEHIHPRAVASSIEAAQDGPTFAVPAGVVLPGDLRGWRGWILPPDLLATLVEHWPASAVLQAEIDAVGPGGASVWVRAGSNQGVRVGDHWWLRVGGQPAASFDVRHVAADVCFCGVTQLARDTALAPDRVVALWPGPGQRRSGQATSAVAFLEERGSGTRVWIAAPVGVACPPEPHVEFYRGGRYVGHGLVEQRDERFWYARLLPTAVEVTEQSGAVAGASSRATTPATPPMPSSAPTLGIAPARLSVGDDVVIRTQADIDARRFVARVFDLAPAGALITAGEADQLAVGDVLTAYRNGVEIGRAVVRMVQRSYAAVSPPESEVTPAFELRVGDELRVGRPPSPPVVVGSVQQVRGDSLFTARLTSAAPPPGTPLTVRAAGRTVGVALLLATGGGEAGGIVLPASQTRPLAPGMQLIIEPEPPAFTPGRDVQASPASN